MVVGIRLGLTLLDADLEPDGEGGRAHTHFASPGAWFRPLGGRLSVRERDFVERVVTTFMAGYAAEVRIGTADPAGSGYDVDVAARQWISYLEPDPGRRQALVDGFVDRAAGEVRLPAAWRAVERVAARLLASGRLDGEQARAVIVAAGAGE